MILDDVDAEKRLQIVRLRDRVFLFQKVTQLRNELRVTGSYCKVIHVDAEVNALSVVVDFEEQTGIMC